METRILRSAGLQLSCQAWPVAASQNAQTPLAIGEALEGSVWVNGPIRSSLSEAPLIIQCRTSQDMRIRLRATGGRNGPEGQKVGTAPGRLERVQQAGGRDKTWHTGQEVSQKLRVPGRVEGGQLRRALWVPAAAGSPVQVHLQEESGLGNGRGEVDDGAQTGQEDTDDENGIGEREGIGSDLSGEREEEDEAEAEEEAEAEVDVEEEALELLEWPLVCRQVAEFTATPMGSNRARRAGLPFGESAGASRVLLAQTAAALAVGKPWGFEGVEDLAGVLSRAEEGDTCSLQELWEVGTTLRAAGKLATQLGLRGSDSGPEAALARADLELGSGSREEGEHALAPLRQVLEGAALCPELLGDIEHCIDGPLRRVLDRASPKLAAVREKRAANSKALQALLGETARRLSDAGATDGPSVVQRRNRFCVGVRAGFKNLLPGGITLDVSNSGATLFIEPEPAIALNNREAELGSEEAQEVASILGRLTGQVATRAGPIRDLQERITLLDLAFARAGHARWLGAARPSMWAESESESAGGPVVASPSQTARAQNGTSLAGTESIGSPERLQDAGETSGGIRAEDERVSVGAPWLVRIGQVRHPLLLGPCLGPPAAPRAQPNAWASFAPSSSKPRSRDQAAQEASPASPGRVLLVPIDFQVVPGVSVVAITGPNTGGKTAALKTLGVAALMAKAGLYVPAEGPLVLPWFDKVLADIGDEQSLEQSLSTFSGHIRRLGRMLQAASPRSLLLLDEVGSGTDPSEGASLAAAVLRHLAGTARLTVATTHYAELKHLKAADSRFENASVEFNAQTLRPAYRLLWGRAGESNAFVIAEARRFDGAVLARARELAGQLAPAAAGARASDLMGPLVEERRSQVARATAARAARGEAQRLHGQLREASAELARRERWLQRQEEQALSQEVSRAQQRMAALLDRLEQAMAAPGEADAEPAGGVAVGLPQPFPTASSSGATIGFQSRTERDKDEASDQASGGAAPVEGEEARGSAGPEQADGVEVTSERVLAEIAKIAEEYAVSTLELSAAGVGNASTGGGLSSGARGGGEEGPWAPAVGDSVVVRRLGATPVIVVEQPESGDELVVQLGGLRMTVKANEVLPAGPLASADEDAAAEARRRKRRAQEMDQRKEKATAQGASNGGISGAGAVMYDARVQTSSNTIDLRGSRVDEAVEELDMALARRRPGSVVFIVHGLGTGVLKRAAVELLRRHRAVAKFEPESGANPGCTVAYIH